jgi:hypothetical protein
MFPTRRNRFTGEPGIGKALTTFTLDDVGGSLDLSAVWITNESVPRIEFRWLEVESIARVRWFLFRPGLRFRLRRGVVKDNSYRSFYLFNWGWPFNLRWSRHTSQMLEFARTRGVRVVRGTELFALLWMDE